jgi:predicted cupin superfamily sugar epimerase
VHPRAAELIEQLGLQRHPEGAWYAELFRSPRTVDPRDGRPPRAALTGIWFLMLPGQRSAWHVVDSDEIWIHFEGSEIRLWTFDPRSGELGSSRLGPLSAGASNSERFAAAAEISGRSAAAAAISERFAAAAAPQRVVEAGIWQAAEPLGDYSLSGACVGPGFDFADFRLLDADPAVRAAIERIDASLLRLA